MLVAVFLLTALNISHAEFIRTFMNMQIQINVDGSANVKNEIRLLMNSTDSINLYNFSIKTTNDLSGWQERLGLSDIRFYTNTAEAPIENVTVIASTPDTCNFDHTSCYGTLTYEYYIEPPTNTTGPVNITKYISPRVIGYSLRQEALSFDVSPLGQQYIPDLTSVQITLPSDAINVVMVPHPVEYADTIPANGVTTLTWQGSLSLEGMTLNFQRKESLESDVANYFDDLSTTGIGWIFSSEGIALVGAAILIGIAYYALQRRKTS